MAEETSSNRRTRRSRRRYHRRFVYSRPWKATKRRSSHEEYEEYEEEEEEYEEEAEEVTPPVSAFVPIKNRQTRPTRQLSSTSHLTLKVITNSLLSTFSCPREQLELDEQEAEVRKRAKILEKLLPTLDLKCAL